VMSIGFGKVVECWCVGRLEGRSVVMLEVWMLQVVGSGEEAGAVGI
jgi:hypothetical protein